VDRIDDSAYGYDNVSKFERTQEELQLAADVDAPLDAVTRALVEATVGVACLPGRAHALFAGVHSERWHQVWL
jgi:hypothetical protein